MTPAQSRAVLVLAAAGAAWFAWRQRWFDALGSSLSSFRSTSHPAQTDRGRLIFSNTPSPSGEEIDLARL